jgi:O-acetyl-ADP-ribose deacetylase (regulator of RNase III)
MIIYRKGDALDHKSGVLVHCTNDLGIMGGGIALAIAKKWPRVKAHYLEWYEESHPAFCLGYIQNIKVSNKLWVCNLFGQRGIGMMYGMPPVRYQSVMEGLYRLKDFMEKEKLTEVVSGRMCCGLAGGSWQTIEKIFNKVFKDSNIKVIIYDLPNENWPNTIYEEEN